MCDQSQLSKPQDSSSAFKEKKKTHKTVEKEAVVQKKKKSLVVKNSSAWCGTLLQRHTMIVLHVNVLTEVCILVLPLTGFANVLVQIRRLITARREMTSDTYKQQGAWKCRLSGSTASDCLIFCSYKLNKYKEFKELSAVPKLQRAGKVVFSFFNPAQVKKS